MRVLQIAHDHAEWTPGGSEIVARDLACVLDDMPFATARLLVAATSLHRPDALPGALGARGTDIVLRTGAYDSFAMTRLDGEAWVGGLARALAAVRPDVAHLHGVDRIGAEIVPALRRLSPRCRIVMTLHDYAAICPNDGLLLTRPDGDRCRDASPDACARCFPEIAAARHALRKAQLLALLAGVDAFVAPSAFLRDRYVAWGIAPGRIEVVPNAVPIAAEPETARRPPRAPNRFAFFGNLLPHKGVLTLLAAAARLRETDVSVTIHGGLGWAEAPFREAFGTALAAAQPVASHAGGYGRDEVVALMRRADWIVAPSLWWENAPLVLAEARAAGRPAIVSGIGGMAELVRDGQDGLHVPPGDAAALAETMRAAAADPALWARLAAAQAPVDHAAFVERHVALYQRLLRRIAA